MAKERFFLKKKRSQIRRNAFLKNAKRKKYL